MKPLIALTLLILAGLACMEPVPTLTVTASVTSVPTTQPAPLVVQTTTATPTAKPDTATIQATVYVRQSADANSEAVASLTTGQTVEIVKCLGEWCKIKKPLGYVWRGCLSDNPDGLLCQAKP
jgi:hypothetical protein